MGSKKAKDGGSQAPAKGGVDVRDLASQSLPQKPFPGSAAATPFRVHLTPEVHKAVWDHAKADKSIEICGVLVGELARDERGPYLNATASIAGEAAQSKLAEVTFTHQTWAKINTVMDRDYPDLSIVGWYHSHPDFGIFLSDRDMFIQEHFFSGPGQIALVVDPVRNTEGVFTWSNGKAALAKSYWVGGEVQACIGAGEEPVAAVTAPPSGAAAPTSAATRPAAGQTELNVPLSLLALIVLLAGAAGYFGGGSLSRWGEQRLVEGVIAHYGIWKVARMGLGEELDAVQAEVGTVSKQLAELASQKKEPAPAPSTDAKAGDLKTGPTFEEVRVRVTKIGEYLAALRRAYAFSPEEQRALQKLVMEQVRRPSSPPVDSPAGTAAPAPADSAAPKADPPKAVDAAPAKTTPAPAAPKK